MTRVHRLDLGLLGTAMVLRLEDIPIEELTDAALSMQRGGVGFYKQSDFVHIDTGSVQRRRSVPINPEPGTSLFARQAISRY